MSVEEKFDEIASYASDRAAKIDCSKDDYIRGLRAIIERLQDDIAAAEEC